MNVRLGALMLTVAGVGLAKSLTGDMVGDGGFPLECKVMRYNFTGTQTDAAGLSCRGHISTFACYGSCDSYEVGRPGGLMEGKMDVCMYDAFEEKTATLEDCDEGVDPRARSYKYQQATSCRCMSCDSSMVNCNSLAKKKRTGEAEASLKGFGAEPNEEERKSRKERKRCRMLERKRSNLFKRLRKWLQES